MFVSTAWAQDGAAVAGLGSQVFGFLPIILIFVIFYFLVLKPQNDEAKKHAKMVSELKKGDAVITQGGLYGVVSAVNDATVKVAVADGVELTLSRPAILRLLKEDEAKAIAKAASAPSKKR